VPLLAAALMAGSTGPLAAQPAPRHSSAGQVGILLPLSGDYAHVGEQLLDALTLALDDQPGATWTVVDSAGDPLVAAARVAELAANPAVIAVVGPVGAAESRAAAEAAAQRRLPLLTLTSVEGIEELGPTIFRLRTSVEQQARRIARIALDELRLDRLAVLYPDDDFGTRAMRAFVDEVVTSGARVTALESYPSARDGESESGFVDHRAVDDAVELLIQRRRRRLTGRPFERTPRTRPSRRTRRPSVDFEGLFIPDFHPQVGVLVHFLAFYEVGLGDRVQLLGLSSWAGPGLRLGAPLVAGALFVQVFHRHFYDDTVAQLVARYDTAYERAPSEAEAQAYDGLTFLLEVLAELPASDAAAARALLPRALIEAAERSGLCGPMSFSATGAVVRPLTLFGADEDGYIGPYHLLH
jgi:ABC-type branched-subunit amino acid transport system substrate-binding protein